jgi:hypothetical protein
MPWSQPCGRSAPSSCRPRSSNCAPCRRPRQKAPKTLHNAILTGQTPTGPRPGPKRPRPDTGPGGGSGAAEGSVRSPFAAGAASARSAILGRRAPVGRAPVTSREPEPNELGLERVVFFGDAVRKESRPICGGPWARVHAQLAVAPSWSIGMTHRPSQGFKDEVRWSRRRSYANPLFQQT